MSLYRTYRIQCDGPSWGRHTQTFLGSNPDHQEFGPGAETSTKARRRALNTGWKRVKLNLPILDSNPSAGTSLVALDLCPACARFAE